MTLPPPPGECHTTRLYDPETGIELMRIDRADAHVAIAPDLITDVANNPSPRAWLEDEPDGGQLLHLHGINRDVVYRLGEFRLTPWGAGYGGGYVRSAELVSDTVATTKLLGP